MKNYKQAGIGLPAAIFVITAMVVIAAAVNLLVSQNAQTFQEDVNLARSFYAAESGAGFAMNRIFAPEDYPTYPTGTSGATTQKCAYTDATYDLIADGINQCTATVDCTLVTISGTNYATIESEGSCGDVERTIQVRTVW